MKKFMKNFYVFKKVIAPVVTIFILYLGCEEDPPTSSTGNLPYAFNTSTGDSVVNATLVGTFQRPCSGGGTIGQWKLYEGDFRPGPYTPPDIKAVTIPCIGGNYTCGGVSSRFGEKSVFIGYLRPDVNGNTLLPHSAYNFSLRCRPGPLSNVEATALHHELVHVYFTMMGIHDHDENQIHCIASAIPTFCPNANNDIQSILYCLYESDLIPRQTTPVSPGPYSADGTSLWIQVVPGCGIFPAGSNVNWIDLLWFFEGRYDLPATVVFIVQCNGGPPRTGSLNVAGNVFEIHQDGFSPYCP